MELEYRAAQVAGVSFPRRLVELVVMPYESETQIREGGREFTEIVSRGAFDGIESRNDKIRVNRDHDPTRPVGRAVKFYPSREEGLVAEIRISQTDLGTDTLTLADDGVLDASAGFALMRKDGRIVPGAEIWETRSRRRLNHLFLGHIAMVMNPAYDAAQVLAVRNTPAPAVKPNLEKLELERWQALYADLDARYVSGSTELPAV